jgi:hypothetical protein
MTDQIPIQMIVHQLTNEQLRLQDQTIREKKNEIKYSARSKDLAILMYI